MALSLAALRAPSWLFLSFRFEGLHLSVNLPIHPNGWSVIYADPAWPYKNKVSNGAAENHYSVMTLDEICALPVASIAADDCALFLWKTYPNLPMLLPVLDAWGFKYKTLAFQWVKLNKKNGLPFMDLGNYTRGNTEPCFLATRGKPGRIAKNLSQLIFTSQEELIVSPVSAHSKKPDEARDRIVTLMGDVPRIELFARQRVKGWAAWNPTEASIDSHLADEEEVKTEEDDMKLLFG